MSNWDPAVTNASPGAEPKSDEAKRLLKQEQDAIENAREDYDRVPDATPPASADTFESPAEGETEPTHVGQRESDRR